MNGMMEGGRNHKPLLVQSPLPNFGVPVFCQPLAGKRLDKFAKKWRVKFQVSLNFFFLNIYIYLFA